MLEVLPEFQRNRFEGVVSNPVLDSGHLIGQFNVCRSEPIAFKASQFSALLSLTVPIAALLAAAVRDGLEREIEKLTQPLVDRKLFEPPRASSAPGLAGVFLHSQREPPPAHSRKSTFWS